ncbi:hypothetical protein IY145_09200 [Methylosinus sp. H3A]|uniref:hypothetical protein n=1 Tax=Methylosinus sp. H3A TaxID=2785786 RepID=UPI0018C20CC1|nr:hypothetical protein [Methylosinus sp. H3A]MBG0809554.1 hypothetical protein [Methylosinus sp. H3A]
MKLRFPLLGAVFGVGLATTAGAGDLGYPASALGEFSAKPRTTFDNAPPIVAPFAVPLAADQSAAPAAPPASSAAAAPLAQAETEAVESPPSPSDPPPTASAGLDEYEARCFVKLEGRVVIAKPCRILRDKDREVIFEIDEGPLTIKLRQGRVWTARLKDRDLGNVYRTGPCWGAKGFYACDRGRI